MGFFQDKEYDYTTAGEFVKEQEKLLLFSQKTPLKVVGVFLNRPSEFGLQDILSVSLDGEDRALPFKAESVPTRHEMLGDLKSYVEANPDEEVYVRLAREGRAWILVDASE